MINKLDSTFDIYGDSLKLRAFRQQVLASNIANADTPNYKAQDFNFGQELKRIMAGGASSLQPAVTNARHLPGLNGNPLGVHMLYRTDTQGNIDGNTVNMDVERAKFTENALRYEAGLNVLNAEIQHIKAALRSQ